MTELTLDGGPGGTTCKTYHQSTFLSAGLDALYVTGLADETSKGDVCRAIVAAVFAHYAKMAEAEPELYQAGQLVLEDGQTIVRPAAGWYKVAVWRGDCRAFLTDHAKMGAHFQFGSKWLKENEGRWIDAALEFIGSLGFDPAQFARLDLARTDLHIDLECEPPDVGEFLGEGWIGKSTAWAVYGKRGAGAQTVYIGRRRSPIMLRVYDKLAEARHDGDLAFWVDVWGRLPERVTRFEWQMRLKRGRIPWQLRDLTLGNIHKLFATCLEWGRLAIPSETDTNRARWELHPLWARVVGAVGEFCGGLADAVKRCYSKAYSLSRAALKSGLGTVSSMIARASVAVGLDRPGDLGTLVRYAQSEGVGGRFELQVQRKYLRLRAMGGMSA